LFTIKFKYNSDVSRETLGKRPTLRLTAIDLRDLSIGRSGFKPRLLQIQRCASYLSTSYRNI